MPETERYDALVIGSGEAGKNIAWTMAKMCHRTAVVERKLIGGSWPKMACLPSKDIRHTAKATSFGRRAPEFALDLGSRTIDMAGVQRRKRKMVEDEIQAHLGLYKASGAELIMGSARFVSPKTVEVTLNGGGTRAIAGDRVFLNLGSRAAIPDVPGASASKPMTHIELLDLDRLPQHLVVIGGGYVGLALAQAMRRFGSRVTVIEKGPQVAGQEDGDVAAGVFGVFCGA